MSTILEYDKTLFLFLNHLGNTTWDGFWLFITNKFTAIPLYLFLLGFCVKKLGIRATILVLIFTALMVTTTDQLANAFKYGIGRLRPCHDESIMHIMRLVKSSCGGKYGFFSAHAANAAVVATFFFLLFIKHHKFLVLLLVLWAFLVGYSRIYIGVHYPLDVIVGMITGIGIGGLFYIIKRKIDTLV